MAVGEGLTLSSIERTWLQSRVTGTTASTPLNELRKLYYAAQVGGTFTTLNEYQNRWIEKVITDNGGTSSSTPFISTLLKEALTTLGLTASTSLSENWRTLYLNYNP